MPIHRVHCVAAGALSWRVATYNAASLGHGRYDDLLSVFSKFDIVVVQGTRLRSDLPNIMSRKRDFWCIDWARAFGAFTNSNTGI